MRDRASGMKRSSRSGRRRIFTLNIGTIVFGVLFIYIIITLILYLTATHVRSYRVVSGPLAANSTCSGIALYSDSAVSSNSAGYVNLYTEDHSKVRSGGIVYGVSPEKSERSAQVTTAAALSEIHDEMAEFAERWSASDFYNIYSLKYDTEGRIMSQMLGSNAAGSGSNLTVGDTIIRTASTDGVVCFETDGYEGKTVADLTHDDFDDKQYQMNRVGTGDTVESGENVYRLITSENWSLIVPLTSAQSVKLENVDTIKVRFLKDGATMNASFEMITLSDGTTCGRLDFKNGMIRYLDNRHIDVELVTNTQIGLKIPVSAIVTRSFFTIPDEYASMSSDSTDVGFTKMVTDSSGNSVTEFVTPTIYEHTGGLYYVDGTDFSAGDIIVRENTTDRYIIRDTSELEGVYNMNKGYAVFRRINILDRNENYCLAAKGDSYGIAQFDNIVEDASTVRDSQITAG